MHRQANATTVVRGLLFMFVHVWKERKWRVKQITKKTLCSFEALN